MKRIISLVAVGIAYVVFVFAFSFINNNVTSAQTEGTTQKINFENRVSMDPIPPPPPKGGD
ncbi:hypothetical protein MUP95_02300 [bacterium]|nr:hypothetical protein [bacterium]